MFNFDTKSTYMKHIATLALFFLPFFNHFASAQCTPEGAFAGFSAGIYPGISVNLPEVAPGDYSASLTINTETDTAITVDLGAFPINAIAYISAMRINAVNGLPAGFNWSVDQTEWNNGGAAPSFTAVQGCISITADAAAVQQLMQANPAGATFPLELVLDARIHSTSNPLLNGAVSNTWLSDLAATVPGAGAQTISGYELVVPADITGVTALNEDHIKIYPNPASDVLWTRGAELGSSFTIYDQTGRLVQEGVCNEENCAINVDKLSSGIFIIRFHSPNNSQLAKIFQLN
jgi:hypothetical protein